jgi:hypothetical protein
LQSFTSNSINNGNTSLALQWMQMIAITAFLVTSRSSKIQILFLSSFEMFLDLWQQ